jgi:hypothetical protein
MMVAQRVKKHMMDNVWGIGVAVAHVMTIANMCVARVDRIATLSRTRAPLGWDLSIGAKLVNQIVVLGARSIKHVIQQMAIWGQMLFRKIVI